MSTRCKLWFVIEELRACSSHWPRLIGIHRVGGLVQAASAWNTVCRFSTSLFGRRPCPLAQRPAGPRRRRSNHQMLSPAYLVWLWLSVGLWLLCGSHPSKRTASLWGPTSTKKRSFALSFASTSQVQSTDYSAQQLHNHNIIQGWSVGSTAHPVSRKQTTYRLQCKVSWLQKNKPENQRTVTVPELGDITFYQPDAINFMVWWICITLGTSFWSHVLYFQNQCHCSFLFGCKVEEKRQKNKHPSARDDSPARPA